uniref:Large ribosomal subunit protein eL36 n=2 Tax=Sus scrofa TaxID=9823 RepID=A0A8D0YT21_PIG
MALCYPMAMGLNKSHKVTKNVNKPRYSRRCCLLTKLSKFLRDMIWAVRSFAPFEGWSCSRSPSASGPSSSSKGWGHTSAPRGSEELSNVLAATRDAAAKKD